MLTQEDLKDAVRAHSEPTAVRMMMTMAEALISHSPPINQPQIWGSMKTPPHRPSGALS